MNQPYVRWRVELTGFIAPIETAPIVANPQPQVVEGDAAPVAAWLRAVADQLDPPRRPMRDARELRERLGQLGRPA